MEQDDGRKPHPHCAEHPFRRRPYRPNFPVVIGIAIFFLIIALIVIQFRKDTKVVNVPPQSDLQQPKPPEPEPPPANEEPGTPINMSE